MSNPELPTSVLVRDVVMRDGIQNLKQVLPTELKIEIIEGLADAGIRRIEATSFMNPKAVPPRRATKCMRRIKRAASLRVIADQRRARRRAWTPGATGWQRSSPSTEVGGRRSVKRAWMRWQDIQDRKGAAIPSAGR